MATGLDSMAGQAARAAWRLCAVFRKALALGAALSIGVTLSLAAARADGRYAAMAVDANSGQILHSEEPDTPRYPASLAKVMTLFLVFEEMERGRLKPETRIRVSEEAASAPPSRLGLDDGDTISVADAIRALITKSANDISVALAEHISGSEERFAALMTRRARELSGRRVVALPDDEAWAAVRDRLSRAES